MQKYFYRLEVSVLKTILLSCLCVFSAQAEKTIKVAYGEFAPWTGKKLDGYGVANKVVKAAFESKGYKVEFSNMPWARCEKVVAGGEYHLSIPYLKNEERLKKFIYSKHSISVLKAVFYKRVENKAQWKNISELTHKKIGGTRGYNYGERYRRLVKTLKHPVQISNNDEIGFKKLIKGRVDYYPMNSVAGAFLAKKMGIENKVTFDPEVLDAQPAFAIFGKKIDPKIVSDFNDAILKLQEDPKFKEYLK